MIERIYYGYGIARWIDHGDNQWYIASNQENWYPLGSRPSYRTLADAKAEVRRRASCHCGAGPFRSMTTKVNHEMAHWPFSGHG